MTTKERLKRLESYSVCDNYREKEEDFRAIKKALEVLDILKERKSVIQLVSNSNGNNIILKETYQFTIGCYDEDYFKIKRWLEE